MVNTRWVVYSSEQISDNNDICDGQAAEWELSVFMWLSELLLMFVMVLVSSHDVELASTYFSECLWLSSS